MDTGHSNWFLGVPVVVIILLNIIFLSRVLLILRAKLRRSLSLEAAPRSCTATAVTARQARAAAFLTPILGINYLLLPIRPESGSQLG